MALPHEEISDEEITNLMDQYFKIVTLIKDDCKKRGIIFGGYGYFRKGDSIEATGTYSMRIGTEFHAYDKWRMEKDFTLSFLQL